VPRLAIDSQHPGHKYKNTCNGENKGEELVFFVQSCPCLTDAVTFFASRKPKKFNEFTHYHEKSPKSPVGSKNRKAKLNTTVSPKIFQVLEKL
jgi:hypothetical protein